MEDNKHLQKELSAKRHEAQALMAEMESTAQAFEEMQEQNIRLLQQLKVFVCNIVCITPTYIEHWRLKLKAPGSISWWLS